MPLPSTYPNPFDKPTWTVNDQKYWNKMNGTYRFPVGSVPIPFRAVIEEARQLTFEAEYAQYLAEQAALPAAPTE